MLARLGQAAIELLDAWLAWGRRCRLAPLVKLTKTIKTQCPGIEAAIQHGLSDARIEQVNTQASALRAAMVIEHGVHPLLPLPTLGHERGEQPDAGAEIQELVRRDPASRQPRSHQQLPHGAAQRTELKEHP